MAARLDLTLLSTANDWQSPPAKLDTSKIERWEQGQELYRIEQVVYIYILYIVYWNSYAVAIAGCISPLQRPRELAHTCLSALEIFDAQSCHTEVKDSVQQLVQASCACRLHVCVGGGGGSEYGSGCTCRSMGWCDVCVCGCLSMALRLRLSRCET